MESLYFNIKIPKYAVVDWNIILKRENIIMDSLTNRTGGIWEHEVVSWEDLPTSPWYQADYHRRGWFETEDFEIYSKDFERGQDSLLSRRIWEVFLQVIQTSCSWKIKHFRHSTCCEGWTDPVSRNCYGGYNSKVFKFILTGSSKSIISWKRENLNTYTLFSPNNTKYKT